MLGSILASTHRIPEGPLAPGCDNPEGLQTLPNFPPGRTVESYWPKLSHSDSFMPAPPHLGGGNKVESRDHDRTTGRGRGWGGGEWKARCSALVRALAISFTHSFVSLHSFILSFTQQICTESTVSRNRSHLLP